LIVRVRALDSERALSRVLVRLPNLAVVPNTLIHACQKLSAPGVLRGKGAAASRAAARRHGKETRVVLMPLQLCLWGGSQTRAC
jgi:hypothetical protein